MQQVSIVIVNWNTGKLLRECLASLVALPELGSIRHVVVVDNASSDDSVQQASEERGNKKITILQQQENLGFAKANNIGIAYIQNHGGQDDHILLLNPDIKVYAGAIKNMLDIFGKNPNAGIVGPKLLETNGDVQSSVRSFPTLSIFMLLFLKLHRLFANSEIWKRYIMAGFDYEKEQVVNQVMGAAFLVRNTLLKEVGLLDEAFWIWFEEVDYCKRAHNAGWEVIYTPVSEITHYKGTSFNQLVGIQKTKPLLDSSLIYAKKHLGTLAHIILCLLYPFGLLIALLASFSHVRQREENNYKL